MNFEKDWRGIVPSLIWFWLMFVPPILRALDIATTSYSVDMDAGILEYKHGFLNRRQDNIDLYRIKNISANENLLTGGKITITNQDSSITILPYILHTNRMSVQLRNIANKKRQDQSVRPLEFM